MLTNQTERPKFEQRSVIKFPVAQVYRWMCDVYAEASFKEKKFQKSWNRLNLW